MLHRHVFFAHFLLTNNRLCRPNCICHQQWYLHLSHSVSLLGSFFRLAFLYLYLHFSLSLSLPHSLTFSLFIIFQSFELFYAQHLRHSLCCEFVSAKMFGINHVSNTSSGIMVPWAFYAKSKGLSVIEFVNVKDFWDLCKIMKILFAPNIILEIFAFEFDCVAILGFIIPWVPLFTQTQFFYLSMALMQRSLKYTVHWVFLSLGSSIRWILSCRSSEDFLYFGALPCPKFLGCSAPYVWPKKLMYHWNLLCFEFRVSHNAKDLRVFEFTCFCLTLEACCREPYLTRRELGAFNAVFFVNGGVFRLV